MREPASGGKGPGPRACWREGKRKKPCRRLASVCIRRRYCPPNDKKPLKTKDFPSLVVLLPTYLSIAGRTALFIRYPSKNNSTSISPPIATTNSPIREPHLPPTDLWSYTESLPSNPSLPTHHGPLQPYGEASLQLVHLPRRGIMHGSLRLRRLGLQRAAEFR